VAHTYSILVMVLICGVSGYFLLPCDMLNVDGDAEAAVEARVLRDGIGRC